MSIPALLADALTPVPPQIAVVATLDGVTTVLVAFVFVCLAMPTLVKNRPQYYAALACVLGIIALHTLQLLFGTSPGMALGLAVGTGVLQIVAFLLLVLSVGGLTVKELGGDMARAYEVMRRGETKKEVIIPIGDQAGRRPGAAEGQRVYRIDSPGPVRLDDEDDDGPIPAP